MFSDKLEQKEKDEQMSSQPESLELLGEEITTTLENLNSGQRMAAIRYLQRFAPQDVWSLDNAETRNEVYNKYITDIAQLIAKIEVYGHKFPIYVWGLIEYLWQLLATASVELDDTKKRCLYEALQKYIIFVENELRYLLAEDYISEIKRYRKIFRHFEHQKVSEGEQIPIIKQIDYFISDAKTNLKRGIKIRNNYCSGNMSRNSSVVNVIKIADVQYINELQQSIKISEQAIEFCENHFSRIVNCKYKPSVFSRIGWTIADIISFAFIGYGAARLLTLFL